MPVQNSTVRKIIQNSRAHFSFRTASDSNRGLLSESGPVYWIVLLEYSTSMIEIYLTPAIVLQVK